MFKFNQYISEDATAGLKKKAEKSGMSLSVLRKVYNRGVAAWKTGHRPGTTPQQWGMARVNSFVTKSSGTWGKADKDLASKVRKEGTDIDELSLKTGLSSANKAGNKDKLKNDLKSMKDKLGKKEEFVSAAQRKAVWANKADGGKGHPDNKKKKTKNEAFDFRVNIDGFPEMFMSGNSPGEVKSNLRQLIKQPSMIKAVDRVSKHDKKKELRKKAMGEGTMGDAPEWGTSEATKCARKKTPGQQKEARDTHCSDKCCGSDVKREDCTCPPDCKHCNCNATNEGIMSTLKKAGSYIMSNDNGKKSSTNTNRRSTSGTQNAKPSPSIASRINFGGKYSK